MTNVTLTVEIGPVGTVAVRYGDISWSLPPDAALLLGRALIAAGTAIKAPEPPAAGTPVTDAHLPVMAWKTGVSNINLEPILMLEVIGGLWLSYQLGHDTAKAVGEALSATGVSGGRLPGQLLS